MKMQESAENYLETILILKNRTGLVRSIDIANELNYSRPSVSRAVNLLRKNDYISVDKEGHISLTETGSNIAKTMYERHTLLSECFIALGVDEAVATADACRIEHVISQQSFDKIREHYIKNQPRALHN